ncbi:MAG: beta-ketoacyl-ACP synthase 3 [Solirubrobacterales bacterium]|nr:beta-ketoacyl-ACP synthase 3 [Solirubrobacterales bacterium]MBV9941331.1 beta-ketoacyl-ACP synthase 3 [Solirubrobacterales bacterium]
MLDPSRVDRHTHATGEPAPSALAPARPAILSVAAEVPSSRVTTAQLAERLGVSEDWIVSRTGIRARPVAADDERLSEFAARAGSAALHRAGVDPADVDLVLVATLTQDELMPNAAPIVAHAVGADRAGAIDLGAACTGFLSGLSLGAAQIETGRADRILLIGADFTTRIVDWEDKRTAPLFGDGVGAVVLGPATGELGSIGPIVLGADGSGAAAIHIAHTDRKLRMDGPEVYRNAVARMGEATLAALAGAGLTLEDIDLFVYHQANGRILRALAEKLQLPSDRVVDVIENLGNSSAATLPLGLAAAEDEGRLKAGARVLLSAFGAGFTWGAGVIEWGGSGDA